MLRGKYYNLFNVMFEQQSNWLGGMDGSNACKPALPTLDDADAVL